MDRLGFLHRELRSRKPKRRVIAAPKFYFADVGVVNHLARRGTIERAGELFGKAFENWVFHELCAYSAYREAFARFSYWRLASGIEVDFIIDDMKLAVEAKASARITSDHLKGLRQLAVDQPKVRRKVVVSLESKRRTTEDGIEILPFSAFAGELWEGALF